MAVDVLAIGELLIDFIAEGPQSDVGHAASFVKNPGGAPANVAVGVSRLALSSAFCGKVGDDPFGRYLVGVLRDEGVNVDGLVFDTHARTTLAFVLLGECGERSFSFFRNPGADMMLRADELNMPILTGCRVLQHGSVSLSSGPSADATRAAVRIASGAGAAICFDINLRLALWNSLDEARRAIFGSCGQADLIKASLEELMELTGSPNEPEAVIALRKHTKPEALIVVTDGPSGSSAYMGDVVVRTHGFTVVSVDTTGAGDGFLACIIACLIGIAGDTPVKDSLSKLSPKDLEASLVRANAAGAICAMRKGAIPSLPAKAEIDEFLAERRKD